jgi:hypothetical protein
MPMVAWLDPLQLIQTGIRTAISAIFGEYADKREMQQALADDESEYPPYDKGELWVDYVADLGDGFESTYTVAYLLAQDNLELETGAKLPRGRLLIMGGDQVYPTPGREGYENRLIGPYRAALPWAEPAPHLFAIPGNHDWYDGLTNFLRFFCTGEWIGGWKTVQKRSYFAVKLAADWWLWGIDIQFDAFIDEPQLKYFARAGKRLRAGDRVLLVTGKPSWTHAPEKESRSYENLRYVEERIVETGGRRGQIDPSDPPPDPAPSVPVMVTGDDHHYARYGGAEGRQKLTSGGGGAFLSATHHLRNPIDLPRGKNGDDRVDYDLKACYPEQKSSRRLRFRVLDRLPRRNPGFLWGVFVAYLVPAILMQVAIEHQRDREAATLWDFFRAAAFSKWTIYAGLILLAFLFLYAAAEKLMRRALLGGFHAVVHLALLAFVVAVSALALRELAESLDGSNWFVDLLRDVINGDFTLSIVASLLAMPFGAIVVAAYLIVCDSISSKGDALGRHITELFASQQITGYKNFLRLHIDTAGALTIYPIAIDDAAKFKLRANNVERPPGDPFFQPEEPINWRLIEQPIVVGGSPKQPTSLAGKAVP